MVTGIDAKNAAQRPGVSLPEDWNSCSLGSEVNLLTGFPFPSSGYTGSGVRLVRGSNVKRGEMDWSPDITEYWPAITSDIARFCLEPGDLVVAMDGALVGRSYAIVTERDLPSLLLQRVARIRSRTVAQSLLPHFIGSAGFVRYVDSVKTHTAIPHISPADIRRFPIAYPRDPAEQHAIAGALANVGASIEILDRLIAKKRATKQGAAQQLLTGQTRLPGFRGEWRTEHLANLAEIDSENLTEATDSKFAFNYISLEQVDRGRLVGFTEETFGTSPSRARRVLRPGDVLMATVRPGLQSHLLYTRAPERAVCSTGFAVLRCKRDRAVPGFIFAQLFGRGIGAQIERILAGSNYPAINRADVRQLHIECPRVDEQTAIAAVLSDMDAEIEIMVTRRDKMRAIKQGMMQSLLTGHVRLKQELASL